MAIFNYWLGDAKYTTISYLSFNNKMSFIKQSGICKLNCSMIIMNVNIIPLINWIQRHIKKIFKVSSIWNIERWNSYYISEIHSYII